MNISTYYLRISCVFGALAVLIGAFGAHTLKARLAPEALAVFETGVKYQFYHTFALLATTFCFMQTNNKRLAYAFQCFITGIILFSGSLYWIATKEIHGIYIGALGILTPIGGLFFIAGWLLLGFHVGRDKA
jgi:uncharacterized membrane protein YgdD (TMEM256/DUF423 family)